MKTKKEEKYNYVYLRNNRATVKRVINVDKNIVEIEKLNIIYIVKEKNTINLTVGKEKINVNLNRYTSSSDFSSALREYLYIKHRNVLRYNEDFFKKNVVKNYNTDSLTNHIENYIKCIDILFSYYHEDELINILDDFFSGILSILEKEKKFITIDEKYKTNIKDELLPIIYINDKYEKLIKKLIININITRNMKHVKDEKNKFSIPEEFFSMGILLYILKERKYSIINFKDDKIKDNVILETIDKIKINFKIYDPGEEYKKVLLPPEVNRKIKYESLHISSVTMFYYKICKKIFQNSSN